MWQGKLEVLKRKRKLLLQGKMGNWEGDHLRIPLTKRKIAIVDRSNSYLLDINFHYSNGYAQTSFQKKHIFLHHMVIGFPLRNLKVDHINGNTLDNRKENLRIVTSRENQQNTKKARKNGYFGCSLTNGRWQARIKINGRSKSLGYFTDKKEATDAYWKRASQLSEKGA